MHTGFLRAAALALLASLLGLACKSSGGQASFLLFDGACAPQRNLIERLQRTQIEARGAQQGFSETFLLYQRLTTPQAVEIDQLSDEFERKLDSCEGRAQKLRVRIEQVQKGCDELFRGWTDELTNPSDDTPREESEALLQVTREHAQRVNTALERVRGRMDSVLQKLRDYALFFRHNLSARAIATLEQTYREFDREVHALNSEFAKTESEIAAFLALFEQPVPTAPGE